MNTNSNLTNLREIVIAINNCDYDHFNDSKIAKAREELKSLLDCDDWTLNELLRCFVQFEFEAKVVFAGY